jgi:hypothetical protein
MFHKKMLMALVTISAILLLVLAIAPALEPDVSGAKGGARKGVVFRREAISAHRAVLRQLP